MEFDWTNSAIGQNGDLTRQEVEESFKTPMAFDSFPTRPASRRNPAPSAWVRPWPVWAFFTVFRSDGKRLRVVAARKMTTEEQYFYERKVATWTS
jgi:uncharacterized DUF497 family protein